MDTIISCCGVICLECKYYPDECKGCPEIKGKAFWLEYTNEKICAIYDCCVNTRMLSHCGKCVELPCVKYNGYDPTKTQEENDNDFNKQLIQLRSMD